LEDDSVELYGIKIYGSPWTPTSGCGWGFNAERGEVILNKWNKIPNDIDVLLTHGPPIGYGDLTIRNDRAGCVELLTTIEQRVKPKFHIFGHIHEDCGMWSNGTTTFINASCDIRYKATNSPIIFDINLPEKFKK
jgi:Icc-related predicted phosphoesterase